MIKYPLLLAAIVGIASPAWAGLETAFETRTHDFGVTPRGPMLTHYFTIKNNSSESMTISGLRVSCGCVVASTPVATIKAGESSYITIQMDTRRFTGQKDVTVFVTFSAPRREEVTLLVKANGRDDLSIYPESLAFGNQKKGAAAKASVQVTFRSDPQWKIDEVKCDSEHVKAEAKLIKREGYEVTYEVTATVGPDLPVGRWRSDVWLHTSNAALAKVRVPLSVDVTAAVTASPGIVDLGEVRVGDSVEQNVMIRADKPFKIKSVRGADSLVQVSGIAAEAKSVHIIRLTYKPGTPGEVKQALAIVADSDEEPIVTIPFHARAIKD